MNKPYPCSDCCDTDPPCGKCLDDNSPQTIDLVLAAVADNVCTGATFLNNTYTLYANEDCGWGEATVGGPNEIDITGDGVKVTDACTAATALRIYARISGSTLVVEITIHDGAGASETARYEYATTSPNEPCCDWDDLAVGFISQTSSGSLGNDWVSSTVKITADETCRKCDACTEGKGPYEFQVVLSSNWAAGTPDDHCDDAECAGLAGTYVLSPASYWSLGCHWSADATTSGRPVGGDFFFEDNCQDSDRVSIRLTIVSGRLEVDLTTVLVEDLFGNNQHNNYYWREDTSSPYDCLNLVDFLVPWGRGTWTTKYRWNGSSLHVLDNPGCDGSAVTCKVTSL